MARKDAQGNQQGGKGLEWRKPFSAPTLAWFDQAFPDGATRVQRFGWPQLASGKNALMLAPTGSGKTLAAFLWAIDQVHRLPQGAPPGVRILYVSPLKALVYDIERNLRSPLIGIERAAHGLAEQGLADPVRSPRVDVRTGDTPQADRRRQLKEPGEILVTTPESLFLLLGSQARTTLATVHTVIIDEIHSIAGSKRGVHLALSLERLSEIVSQGELVEAGEPQRIGLSATVDPPLEAARFLGGDRPVEIVDASEPAHISLQVVVPVADMEHPPNAAASRSLLDPEEESEGPREGGLWPSIYPRVLDLIEAHRSTIVFTNSRGLCERLAQRLNDLWREKNRPEEASEAEEQADLESIPDLVRAHHGSVSHAKRAEIEEALKSGELRSIVATSSLELGIDMGAVDLVILVESPGSVSSGLQRVGRAGHQVGETSVGVIFPKYRGDLLEAAVVAGGMAAGRIEPLRVPNNPLDVLAQQIVALCCDGKRSVDELYALVRRCYPYRELTQEVFTAVLDMLSGRYPSEELADLRPRLNWDRGRNLLEGRPGAAMLTRFNAGTIPDRGLYTVHLGDDGPRLGELDEEMVHESRPGDTFYLGASTWRVQEITRDRVIVSPAPGQPGRMPFWHGEGPGRPIELGRELGRFVREAGLRSEEGSRAWLNANTPLDEHAISNLVSYLQEQKEHTGTLPTDRAITIERFRDELGDWRISILTPFGARVHAPWAMAIEARLSNDAGYEVQTLYTDDGIVLRLPDADELPPTEDLLPDPEEIEELVVEQVGNSALFASIFRENASRALLLPRRRPGKRTALWQQRLRAKNLLAVVKRYADFPIVLETYRHCLRDVFDMPALIELLSAIRRREVLVQDVETESASPFARSLVYAFVGQNLYDLDAPLAERRAQALTLDRGLLRELLGQEELRDLLDLEVIEEIEAELQGRAYGWRARNSDQLHDLLRRIGDVSVAALRSRTGFPKEAGDEESPENGDEPGPESYSVDGGAPVEEWLDRLVDERRAVKIRVADEERFVAAEDAARYRDALGVMLPPGLPDALLTEAEAPFEALIWRYARSHGPFVTEAVARHFSLMPSQIEPVLKNLESQGRMFRGEIRPGGAQLEWCEPEVLRRIKRRTLAKLRREVAPVDRSVLGRFLPRWQEISQVVDEPEMAGMANVDGAAPRSRRRRISLEEVVAQLEGLALPWSTLNHSILPARLPDYEPSMLDMLAATGEVVWVGRSPLGSKDGKVALYRRDQVADLLVHDQEYEPPSELHSLLLGHLAERGACFTTELERPPSIKQAAAGDSQALEQAIWDLVWAGQVTNDTFLPLQALGGSKPRTVRTSSSLRSPRRGAYRPRLRSGGRPSAMAGGRWSLVRGLVEEERERSTQQTAHAHALSVMLLERYGVICRETALAEEVPGGFAFLYPMLREMEDAGRVRRGYFIDGLAGRQFALAGAVDRLRAEREIEVGAGELFSLAVVDPANPWGSLLPWPDTGRGDGPKPRRVAGAFVILLRGEPMLYLDATGKKLITFERFHRQQGSEDALRALEELQRLARQRRRRSLLVEKIDGVAPRDLSRVDLYEQAGFTREYRGLIWSLSSRTRGGVA